MLVDPAADRPHPRARHHRAGDGGNGDRRRTGRAAVAGGRDPSIRAARPAAIRGALPRSLAAQSRLVRGIRPVAQSDHGGRRSRHSADIGQRPRVGALVPALADRAAHDRSLAQPFRSLSGAIRRGCHALCRTRRAALRPDRQPQARRAGAAGGSDQAVAASGRHRYASGDRRRIDAPGRGDRTGRCASNGSSTVFRDC